MRGLTLRLACAFLLLAACSNARYSWEDSDDETTNGKTYIDVRRVVPLGGTATAWPELTLYFHAVTGPTLCVKSPCYPNPATAIVHFTVGEKSRILVIPFGHFARAGPYVVGYVDYVRGDTPGTLSAMFRIVEENAQRSPFGEYFELTVDKPILLPDAHVLRLTEMHDGRCPCRAICFWEGLASVRVTVWNGDIEIGRVTFDDHMGDPDTRFAKPETDVGHLHIVAKTVALPTNCDPAAYLDEGSVTLGVRED